MFHRGAIQGQVGMFTGDVEIYYVNRETGEEWECFGGKYTREADASDGAIQYYDVEVPEDNYTTDFGYYWIIYDENREYRHWTTQDYDYNGYNFQFTPSAEGYVYVPPFISSEDLPYSTGSWNIIGQVINFSANDRLLALKMWPWQ